MKGTKEKIKKEMREVEEERKRKKQVEKEK